MACAVPNGTQGGVSGTAGKEQVVMSGGQTGGRGMTGGQGDDTLVTLTVDKHADNLLKQLHIMQESGIGTDVCLESGDAAVSCHKAVLMAASPYFRELFSDTESDSTIIDVSMIHSFVLPQIVNFIYTSSCDVQRCSMEHLVRASNLLNLTELTTACVEQLIKEVGTENCLRLNRMAQQENIPHLENAAYDVMLKSFHAVTDSPAFLTLTPDELTAYISDDDLDVPDEDGVVSAVLRWLKTNTGHTEEVVEGIVSQLRLPFCSELFLSRTVSREPLFRREPFLDYMLEARDYQVLGKEHVNITKCHTVPRESFVIKCLTVVGGEVFCQYHDYSHQYRNEKCWYWNDKTKEWIYFSDVPVQASFYSVCQVPCGLLLTGGLTVDYDESATCNLYRTDLAKWVHYKNLNRARSSHSSVFLDGKVYVLGGQNKFPLSSVEVSDMDTETWSFTSQMPQPRQSFIVAGVGTNIYVMGGKWKDNSLFSLNTRSQRWVAKASMPVQCCYAAVTVKDAVLVLGGHYDQAWLLYNTTTNNWTTLSPPRCLGHNTCGAVFYQGRVLIGGGIVGREVQAAEPIDCVHEYNMLQNRWEDSQVKLPVSLNKPFLFSCTGISYAE